MDTRTLLLAAADLVSQGWTQGAMARDAHGNRLTGGVSLYNEAGDEPTTPEPVCWCAFGVIAHVARLHGADDTGDTGALSALTRYVGCHAIGPWNDASAQTQANVVRTMRACAESLAPPVAAEPDNLPELRIDLTDPDKGAGFGCHISAVSEPMRSMIERAANL